VLNSVFVSSISGLVRRPTDLFTVVTFYSVRACRSRAFGRRFLFFKSFSVMCPVFPFAVCFQKFP